LSIEDAKKIERAPGLDSLCAARAPLFWTQGGRRAQKAERSGLACLFYIALHSGQTDRKNRRHFLPFGKKARIRGLTQAGAHGMIF
jgi:hypothetical protein